MQKWDIYAARDAHLRTLRRDIVPSKQEIVSSLRHFISNPATQHLGSTLCERVFYKQDYEVSPRLTTQKLMFLGQAKELSFMAALS